ncbi:MAG: signal recognition particle-docking protein FtsY [Ignavibacteriales bacterium]|nr:signal recognition particle-docking protein FtsY [Ignavibacteriales bacterium]
MGLLGTIRKFTEGLAKTRDSILGKVDRIVNAKSKIDRDVLEQLEEVLLGADVGSQTTEILMQNIERRVKEEKYEDSTALHVLLRDEIAKLLHVNGDEKANGILLPEGKRPYVILVVGVNGVGKTTTIGKLAYNYRQAGYRVVIGAADTFRAAANEQLELWAQRAGAEIIQQAPGADPAAVAYDTVSSAVAKNTDVVIIDTAGRLHTKVNLMEELRKIRRVVEKRMPGAPHEVLLVLDAGTGQNGIQQARQFTSAVQVTGLVLTKLDGTAKGGIVLAISHEMQVPVKYIGIGESIDDLQPFDRKAFVDALFNIEHLQN